ncbi:MAG: tetratricopeptide repeat protein [Pseudomonadota bacterium]
MTDTPPTTRQRGIKASPYRLTRARKAAGFASQAAVAEKIAELEGLENAPKDVVNRAFRGVKVSPDTIERLALALNVEAHTLLWTADEEAQHGDTAADAPPAVTASHDVPGPRTSRVRIIAAVCAAMAVLAVLAVLAIAITNRGTPQSAMRAAVPAFEALAGGDASLLITAEVGTAGPAPIDAPVGALTDTLSAALGTHFTVASAAGAGLQTPGRTARGIGAIRTSAHLTLKTDTVNRWSGLSAWLEADGVRRIVWAETLPTYRIALDKAALADRLREAVLVAIGAQRTSSASDFPSTEAHFDVISGLALLDDPPRELNLQRAQSRFEAALRRSPNDALAHAGLCRALLEKYWMLDEARAIEDAAATCARADALAPDDPAVQLARARLLQVGGRNDDAIALLTDLLFARPDDADALSMLTVSQITRFQTLGDPGALQRGRAAALRAGAADPFIWKPYYHLSQIEFLRDDVAQAIAAIKQGLARSENSFLLANLGTYETCVGNFGAAQTAIERSQALAPGAYVGDEFMGQLMYFQGRFDEALALRKKAIDSFEQGEPALHDMWGSLADAYRQTGRRDEAVEAYRLAINVVETDLLNQDASQSARAARLYYYARLAELAPDILTAAVADRLEGELDAVADAQIEPLGYRYMTLAFALNDRPDDARRFLTRATTRCAGYRQYPDIAALALE